jgi:outer membrane protein assembly factor BamE (lipoprotein component of BamABCDE complex)
MYCLKQKKEIEKMLSKFQLIALFLVIALLSGCTTMTREDICKLINAKPDDKLYTQYNLHHRGYGIPAVNYQWGTITPLGSEVDIYVNWPGRIKLTDKKTGEFMTLKYNSKYSHGTLEDFLKNLITTKDFNEQTKGIPKKTLNYILSGMPVIGMNKDEVIQTCGYPPRHRTQSLNCNTWVYWRWKIPTFTIIFDNNGIVIKGKAKSIAIEPTPKIKN